MNENIQEKEEQGLVPFPFRMDPVIGFGIDCGRPANCCNTSQLEKRTTWQTKAGGPCCRRAENKRKKDNVMSYNTWGPFFYYHFCAAELLLYFFVFFPLFQMTR